MNYKALLAKAKFKRDHALASVIQEEANLERVNKELADHQKAVEVVQLVAQAVEQAVHSKIASVVSSCLEAIMDDPYTFNIRFERKRNRTEASLSFIRGELEVDPMTAAGGGAVDVATFALRVACLTLKKDIHQVLILDEPCKFLSRDLQPRLRPLLEELSNRLGIQFIIVTHMETLRKGHVVDLSS